MQAPLEQFKIIPLIKLNFFLFDFSITNFFIIEFLTIIFFIFFIFFNKLRLESTHESTFFFLRTLGKKYLN